MFKKILIALTLFVLVFTLVACSINNVPPTVKISEDGYWVINGEKTDVKARGEDGKDAEDPNITDENPQGLAFYPKDNGTYAVEVGYAKRLSKIVVPSSYKGKPVTEVAGFSNHTSLKEIVIPDSVTTISDYAFLNCFNLTSITIPDSVTTVGTYAFSKCTSLTSVTIPDSVTSIDFHAFSECTSLTSVIIGNSVTSIDFYAFSNCTSLTNVTIPDSVTYIGGNAFRDCTGLTAVTIPDSVTIIDESAFYNCSGLTSVIFENTSGWKRNGIAISSTELSDPAKAAELLKASEDFVLERS